MIAAAQAPAFRSDTAPEGQAQSVTLQVTALMLALLVPTALGALFDERLTDRANGWLKPLRLC